jgi:hypothetical protein
MRGPGRTASSAPAPITLAGHAVRPDGAPIAHLLISLYGTSDSAVTRDDGGFVLHPPRPGAYMVGARGLGLREKRFAMTLAAGATQDVTITMLPFVPRLPRVVTTAEDRAAYASVGFDKRKRLGVGQFLTYDQIVRARASTFTQLLQGISGLLTTQGPLQSHTPGTSVTGGGRMGTCMSYVLDGTPQQLAGGRQGGGDRGGESPDNLIDVAQVGAVEVYSAAERPAGFGGMDDHPAPQTLPPDRSQPPNPTTGVGSTQRTTPGTEEQPGGLPDEPCGLVMVWTRGRLGLSERTADQAPMASTQRTAAHDITQGLAAFPRGSCNPPAAADTLDLLVYASVQGPTPRSMSDAAWSGYRDQVLAGLAGGSDVPSEVLLPTFGLPGARGSPHGVPVAGVRGRVDVAPVLSTVLSLTLDTTGAIEDMHVAASSLSGSTDTSAMAMVEQAAAAHAFPRVAGLPAASDSIQLYLVIEGAEAGSATQATVLGQLEVPVWRLSRPARLVSSAPRSDRKGGAARDSITVTMVVDSTGQVANGTARFEVAELVPGSLASASETRLLQMLPALRFEPATIGSCRVSSLVTQSFATSDVMTPKP